MWVLAVLRRAAAAEIEEVFNEIEYRIVLLQSGRGRQRESLLTADGVSQRKQRHLTVRPVVEWVLYNTDEVCVLRDLHQPLR